MVRRTKIIATVGPQRTRSDENPPIELAPFDEQGKVPRGRMLRSFVEAGADLIRLNMAFAAKSTPYGDNERQYLSWLLEHSETIGKPVAVIADLPGPKVRLGEVSLDASLSQGDRFDLGFGEQAPRSPGASVLVNALPFSRAVSRIDSVREIADYLRASKPGEMVLSIGDGKVELTAVKALGGGIIECKVRSENLPPEYVAPGKGLTITRVLADLQVEHPSLTVDAFQEADRRALRFVLEHGGDMLAFVAVSFTQTRQDILRVRYAIETDPAVQKRLEEVRKINPRIGVQAVAPGVIAKIETRTGWKNIDEILDVVDAVMVARGDLGEQLPAEEVPAIQKNLIRKCNVRGKPVITATQMLDSMEKKPSPTRAEAADVFNAILDGTDAVMLSGETSIGSYPLRAIKKMAQIAVAAEKYYFSSGHWSRREEILEESREQVDVNTRRLEEFCEFHREAELGVGAGGFHGWARELYDEKAGRSGRQATTDRICEAACGLSESGDYKAILVPTSSGRTAFMISRFRPAVPILGAAHFASTYRKLVLGFGIKAVLIGSQHQEIEAILRETIASALGANLLGIGDQIVATSGTPLYQPGTTNLVQILKVEQP